MGADPGQPIQEGVHLRVVDHRQIYLIGLLQRLQHVGKPV